MAERVIGGAAVGAWLLAGHAAVNARRLRRPPASPAPSTRSVSALVPARDEADRIGACVRALLASEGACVREVLVLDDGSADGTAEVARAAAEGDPRLRVLAGEPLPPGWLGKPHACAQLAEAATGDVLVFVDADVVVEPHALAAVAALVEEGPLDLVCPYPRQEADGPGPRLVQPLLQWSWLTFAPLRAAERAPRRSTVVANGQLAACAGEAYRRAGGHAAVRDAVLDDLELGRAFVAAGMRAGVVDGSDLARCRMYEDWGEVRDGYAKSLWAAFGSPLGAAAVVGMLAWLYVLPGVAAVAGRDRLRGLGVVGLAGGVAGRVVAARRTRGRPGDAMWHPVSVAALGWLTGVSLWRRATGRLEWRGRALPAGTRSGGRRPSWRPSR